MKYTKYALVIIAINFFGQSMHAQDKTVIETTMDIRTMEKKYPEVFSNSKPNHPDTAYEIGKQIPDFINYFGSDEGKSQFYLLYAQHLQKLNKTEFAANYRTQFLDLYQSINRVNELIDIKVGFYYQMQTMLIAYAEYALYEFNLIDQSKFVNIDVQKQKKFFIKSIQQKVKTRNQQLNLNSKPNYSKNQDLINTEIKKIENLISDAYTLKVSQVFHYKYY